MCYLPRTSRVSICVSPTSSKHGRACVFAHCCSPSDELGACTRCQLRESIKIPRFLTWATGWKHVGGKSDLKKEGNELSLGLAYTSGAWERDVDVGVARWQWK